MIAHPAEVLPESRAEPRIECFGITRNPMSGCYFGVNMPDAGVGVDKRPTRIEEHDAGRG
jgi:hypothetical protein